MADNINTPFLDQGGSTDFINSAYLGTESASTEEEENPRTFSSEVSFTDVVSMDGAVTLGAALNSASAVSAGAITGTVLAATSKLSLVGETGIVGDSTGTTTSADSSVVGDGEFGFFESTNTNVTLIYRSGNTTYHWVSSNGSVG